MESDDQSRLLDEIARNPYDFGKHKEHIELCESGNDIASLHQARQLKANYFPLSQSEWIEWLEESESKGLDQSLVDQLFSQATNALLSVELCRRYADWLIRTFCSSQGYTWPVTTDDTAEETVMADTKADAFDEDTVRSQLELIVARASQDVSKSYIVWNMYRDFEMVILRHSSNQQVCVIQKRDNLNSIRQTSLQRIYDAYMQRLSEPHNNIEQTFQDFSTFVSSNYDQQSYEEHLVSANQAYSQAKATWDRREPFERTIVQQGGSAESYLAYIAYEKTGKKATFSQAPALIRNLFDRAVSELRNRADWQNLWVEFITHMDDQLTKAVTAVQQAMEEDAEAVDQDELMAAGQALLETAIRATKNVPYIADAWAALMRAQERCGQSETVEETFQEAKGTTLIDKDVEGLVTLYTARADFHRRAFEAIVESEEEAPAFLLDIVEVTQEGVEAARQASKGGDPQFRLEKYLTRTLERYSRIDEAEAVWKKTTNQNKSSVVAWLGSADFEIRRNNIEGARKVYQQAAKARLDAPEYLFEAWRVFEHQHGSVTDFEAASKETRGRLRAIYTRRAKEAAEAPAQPEVSVPPVAPVVEAVVPNGSSTVASNKRAASQDPSEAGSDREAKRTKLTHEPVVVKRDRENCTVQVSNIPATATKEHIEALFQDCGQIRESSVYEGEADEARVAAVEFHSQDSIAAALTRDKKRIQGEEVVVELAWRATLFITNFPESTTEQGIRDMFKYGRILELRYPSKRFKSSRRFCYIQYASSAAAERSLELHEREMEPGRKMSVQISDPSRRKQRTDINANRKEIFVAGLARSVVEADLRNLFEKFGNIVGVRVATDDKTHQCRGFAFVDFEEESMAAAALSLNSTELKKRNISVVIADARQAGTKARSKQTEGDEAEKEAARSRSVKVTGLPDGVQEEHIRQAFDSQEKVAKVILNLEKLEATVEFEAAASVGKVLMLPTDAISIQDTPVTIAALGESVPADIQTAAKKQAADGSSFKPRVFSKRGGGPSRSSRRGLGA